MAAADGSRITAESLEAACVSILLGYGADDAVARDVALSCVKASLRGVDSHGLALLPKIVARVLDPTVGGAESSHADLVRTQLKDRAVVVPGLDESLPIGIIDARLSPGQHSCQVAARLAAAKAKKSGIALVTVRNSTHFGAAAPFLQTLLQEGLVGMVGSNCTPSMAGLGSPVANMGNMPWGFCAPVAGDDTPDFLFDFCCAVMSYGRLNRLQAAGEAVPDGAFRTVSPPDLQSGDARTFTNAAALTSVALPFGGHKGSSVAMMIEVLAGCLSLGHFGADAESVKDGAFLGPSHFVLAIDPAKFGGGGEGGADGGVDFAASMRRYVQGVKGPAPEEIQYAGERAAATAKDRAANGIPVTAELQAALRRLAAEVGATIDLVAP